MGSGPVAEVQLQPEPLAKEEMYTHESIQSRKAFWGEDSDSEEKMEEEKEGEENMRFLTPGLIYDERTAGGLVST